MNAPFQQSQTETSKHFDNRGKMTQTFFNIARKQTFESAQIQSHWWCFMDVLRSVSKLILRPVDQIQHLWITVTNWNNRTFHQYRARQTILGWGAYSLKDGAFVSKQMVEMKHLVSYSVFFHTHKHNFTRTHTRWLLHARACLLRGGVSSFQ